MITLSGKYVTRSGRIVRNLRHASITASERGYQYTGEVIIDGEAHTVHWLADGRAFSFRDPSPLDLVEADNWRPVDAY